MFGRSTTQRRHQLALISLCVMLALAGCTDAPAALRSIDGDARVCAPQNGAGRAVFGISGFENASDRVLVVSAMELRNAHGAVLIGGQILEADDPDAHYVGDDFDTMGPKPFKGGEVEPGATVFIKVALQVDPTGGSADGVHLRYLDQGREHSVDTRIAMRVAAAGLTCWDKNP